MKKKMLECKIHGLTLHRCKGRYWHSKKDEHSFDYKEECFKCRENKNKVVIQTEKKSKHISI